MGSECLYPDGCEDQADPEHRSSYRGGAVGAQSFLWILSAYSRRAVVVLRLTAKEFNDRKARLAPKKSKYNAKKKMIDGIEFDSTREARQYQDLVLQQQAGQIQGLRRQVAFPIFINNILVCEWFADFVYRNGSGEIVRDCKGFKTPVYKLKKKMVEASYGIKILET